MGVVVGRTVLLVLRVLSEPGFDAALGPETVNNDMLI